MRALVFGVPPEPFEVPDDANTLTQNLAHSPVGLREVPDPQPLHDDWVVTRPRLTGICGSDSKQILLDFGEGDTDNAMAAFCSFPQVMGHEVVADVVALGPAARGLEIGQRVVLNPWLSCGPRGIEPRCPACETGDYSLCWSFTDGDIKPGIHTGVSADVTGGYAELMPAHDSMLFAVPDSVPDEVARVRRSVLGVAARDHPASTAAVRPGRRVRSGIPRLVCARGAAGAVPAGRGGGRGALRRPGAVGTPVGRGQGAAARTPPCRRRGTRRAGGGRLRQPLQGLPMAYPGAVDVVYDTVGKPETFEVGVRVLKARGTLVKAGVHAPGRWEWSPLYFKEINWVGSNAFGVEEVDGQRKHAIAHYLDLVVDGRVDLRPMLTHTFRLEQWRDAFLAIANQGESGAVKVAIDFR